MTASITCPVCAMTSHNPNDVSQGYCGNCHDWTGAVVGMVNAMPFNEVASGMFYDRQNHPISLARYTHLMHDYAYRVIVQDEPVDGVRVSTVWLGNNMALLGPPVVFETALFIDDKVTTIERWASEDEARAMHATLVRSLRLVGRAFLVDLAEGQAQVWDENNPLEAR